MGVSDWSRHPPDSGHVGKFFRVIEPINSRDSPRASPYSSANLGSPSPRSASSSTLFPVVLPRIIIQMSADLGASQEPERDLNAGIMGTDEDKVANGQGDYV